jgi:hypothetical protein
LVALGLIFWQVPFFKDRPENHLSWELSWFKLASDVLAVAAMYIRVPRPLQPVSSHKFWCETCAITKHSNLAVFKYVHQQQQTVSYTNMYVARDGSAASGSFTELTTILDLRRICIILYYLYYIKYSILYYIILCYVMLCISMRMKQTFWG